MCSSDLSLVPAPFKGPGLVAAALFGATAGGLRIAFGGHFFTDVVFSGVIVVLIVVGMRLLLYDRKGAPTDFRVEHAIGRLGYGLHALVRGVARAVAKYARSAFAALRGLIGRHLPGRGAGL